MVLRKISLLSIALMITSLPAISAQKVCADKGSGVISVKSKCSAAEQTLSLDNISTIAEGRTNYLASCRTIKTSNSTSNGAAGAQVTCGTGEFLLNYGDYVTPVALTVTRHNEITYSGDIPSGVIIVAQTDYGVPNLSITNTWTLNVTGTCCPKI
jgi:hypothetical protein